ncbi:13604_t:CDS:2 [Acaulospora colombiana]|uniref:13604_t:CDS:1 n=1 Tax=Acaulospora colombiana TaxID=27376 RepID=A0ACA9KAJ3_9GLOM|nr:13604_t:CDS:2 [Acaulospora colombiana]
MGSNLDAGKISPEIEKGKNSVEPEVLIRKSDNQEIDNFLKDSLRRREYSGLNFWEWIPYEEFSNIQEIGQGGFGQVYKATWNEGKIYTPSYEIGKISRTPLTMVALKVLDKSSNVNSELLEEETPECWKNLMKRCWELDPSDRPEIEEIMKMSEETKIYSQQFMEAEESRQKTIHYGTLLTKEHESIDPNSIYCSRLLNPVIEAARSILGLGIPVITRPLVVEVDKIQHGSLTKLESKEICSDCHKKGKLANAACEFCYFRKFNLKMSGNKDIDDFLRELMGKDRPNLEWIPYEEFSSIEKNRSRRFESSF